MVLHGLSLLRVVEKKRLTLAQASLQLHAGVLHVLDIKTAGESQCNATLHGVKLCSNWGFPEGFCSK